MLAPGLAAQDIGFDPAITQEEFREFSEIFAQTIYATPVEPARSRSLLGFDIGLAVTAIEIDEDAAFWVNSVESDFLNDGYLLVPRLVVAKGLGAVNVSGSYAKIPDTDIDLIGGALDLPILDGGLLRPTLAIRGTYSELRGIDEFSIRTYGAEAYVSKAFGPITPYAGGGITRYESEGHIDLDDFGDLVLSDEQETERFTIGLRISLLLPKIVIEATEGVDRTYSAKVSLGI